MQDTSDRIESIFGAALALASTEARAAYLEQACAGDPALRQQIERLLKAHDRADHFLDRPAVNPELSGETMDHVPPSKQVGTVIAGRYKLLEQIGEGGMGAVWVAEQTQPVRRKVAVKLIKAGMDSKTVLSRFEAERQALALMDHPNIAKVLDGGTTESGRPFFVMEYVKGVPITRYCDDARLSIAERLALFVPVCQAVQHAHQKGIIHRDLKPSNILICLYDGQPVPKVIDFGLAKAMHQPLTEHTLYTAHGLMMGTPLYMSPEQAEFNNLDVDTRTDIYALGVILYELLTGTTPLEKQRFKEAAWQEMLRLIKDEEPPRPSARLSGSGSLPSVAAQRRLEPVRLTKLVRGELDWIVMKCLEKDRGRRYATANGLAKDVERYLHDEPVEACPPSTGYRLRKFVRKHRAGLATVAALVALLLLGSVVCTWQAVRAARAEAAALELLAETEAARAAEAEQRRLAGAAADAEKKSKEAALAREAETQAVLDFVENQVFASARPEGQAGGLGPEVTLRRALEAALPFVDKSFRDQPLIEARLRLTLGSCFHSLAERKIALEQYQTARTLYTKYLGPDHPDTLRSMLHLADYHRSVLQHAKSRKLYEEAMPLLEAKLGLDHPDTLVCMTGLANSYRIIGRPDKALELNQKVLALRKAKLGPDHPNVLASMHALATTYYFGLHQKDVGLKLFEETLRLRDANLGPNHPATLATLDAVAVGYQYFGRDGEALKLFEESLKRRTAVFGPLHSSGTVWGMNNLAWFLLTASDVTLRNPPRALELAKKATELQPDTTGPRGTYGTARYRTGDWKGAIEDLEKVIRLRKPDSPLNAHEGFFIAMAHWQLGEKDRAREWFTRSVRWMEKGNQQDAEQRRFRAEAADLLGVEKKD
jgi:serine/threonine protein kinase/tetratricopeptide (TPR) repeat protein